MITQNVRWGPGMLCTSDGDNSMLYMLSDDTWQQCQYVTHVKW